MDEFYGMNISKEDKRKITSIREALPENVRDFITYSDVQKLLNTNINELATQITKLFTNLGIRDGQQIGSTCEEITRIIYPSQTTEINNNNTNIYERECLNLIRDSIFSEAQVKVDNGFARELLKETNEDARKAMLLSKPSWVGDIDKKKLSLILEGIKEINYNYQTALKNQIKCMAQNGINSETYATDSGIVEEVSNIFKKIFDCSRDLSTDEVKQLLTSDDSKRKSVLSSILKRCESKEKNSASVFRFLSSIFQNNEQKLDPSSSFLSYINNIIIEFYKSSINKKETIQTNKIFSDKAVDSIIDYFTTKYKNYKYDQNGNAIDFANEIFEKEIMDNRASRFSLEQINKMLSFGVSPDCLLAITNFDVYIKLKCEYLNDDIKNGCNYLCREFIDFLYMYVDKGCINKTDPDNELTPKFAQNLISKYIKDKKLNKLEQIKSDPVICSLFYKKDGNLRDKEQINKLLGSDEEIFEMFMKANIHKTLLENVLNINILWEFSNDWLDKNKDSRYADKINSVVSKKKLMTFKFVDLLDNEEGKKNETLNNLLAGGAVCCGGEKFSPNQTQIAQTKAIQFIAQDLQVIEKYLNPNKDKSKNLNKNGKDLNKNEKNSNRNEKNLNPNYEKNKACLKVLEKIFNHQFCFDNLADVNFFTQLVTFLKNDILAEELNKQDINDITTVDELKNILNETTISYLFENAKSDFVMSVLLDSVLGDYLKISNFTAQYFAEIFEAVFEKVHELDEAIGFKHFKKVFIKTFVAKTKNMKRPNLLIKDENQTVLQFVLDQMEQINQLLGEKNKKYTFDNDEIDYFNICLGIIEENEANFEEFSQDKNVIYDQERDIQKSMDNLVFDFLRGKFDLPEKITNQENKNTNQININGKNIKDDKKKDEKINNNHDKDEDVKQESNPRKEEKNNSFITGADYLSDGESEKLYGKDGEQSQHNKQNEENLKVEEEKIKTKTMKLECIVDLYNIDKDTVEDITNLDTGNLNVNRFFYELDVILNNNKYQTLEFKNRIKRCYIDQFFFGKTFTKTALMAHNKAQKHNDGRIIDFESNWKKYFETLFNNQKNIDSNKKNILDQKDINYFWTTWKKRYSYFDSQIKLAQIDFTVDSNVIYPDEEYEKKYLEGLIQAREKYNLDKEFSKSKNDVEGKYNLHADIIKEIDLQVESSRTASFENFFFGYLSVLKKTVTEVNAEFKKENLSDFQKCYIQKFLMWHRNNKNAKSINRQFLLDMYFFFNKNSGKPQNIFGEEVVTYFNDCITKWFVDDKKSCLSKKPTVINLKFDEKLEPLKSSVLDEIQIIEMDQTENLGPWFLEYFDSKKIARERRKKIDEAKKLISEQVNKQQNREENKVVYFNLSKMKRKLPFEKRKEEEKKSEKDNDQKNIEVNISGINDKNLIEDKIQKIDQEIKIDDVNNKKENTDGNDTIDTNDINVENNTKNQIEIEKIGDKNSNNNPQENRKENDIENDISRETVKSEDSKNINANKKYDIEGIKNDINKQFDILTDNKKQENEIKEKNNLIPQTNLITEINSSGYTERKEINLTNSQSNQSIKINCLPNYNIENEHTKYMNILYGLNTKIINEIDEAISNLGFPQNFDFLSPLNQILNQYDKQKEKQTKRYYIDRFFDSDLFKTHMQEAEFESMFNFPNKDVFNDDNIAYFQNQWKKTVLLHFDSQQFKNQELKLKMNENFCLEATYSPSKSHNISTELVKQIDSSVEKFKYDEPEDFFRGYHILFKSENKKLINKDNELGAQKYYIESFLPRNIEQNTIDIKFLRHVDFRFRGYLLKKQTVFNDEATKYFYELLEKLLLGNKENGENEIGKSEVNDEINGLKIKNFGVNITSVFPEKQKAEKNCHNYKIAFWFLLISAVLFGVASYFWVYFFVLAFIATAFSVFCSQTVKYNKAKISSLITSGRCLLSTEQIDSYKKSVEKDVICDEKIDYFSKMQEDERKMRDYILKTRNDEFEHESK